MKRVRFESLTTTCSRVVLVAATAIVAACAAPAGEKFFALNDGGGMQSTTPVASTAARSPSLPGIVISAVTVPELVDRPQIVTRDAANRVVVSEQNLWAEPIRSGIARILATGVARALSDAGRPAQVTSYPQSSIANPVLRITVDVVRFDAVPNGDAVIDAIWSVRRTSDGTVRTGRTVASAPIAGATYDAIVHAWNEALRVVDRDIATMVEQVGTGTPPPAAR